MNASPIRRQRESEAFRFQLRRETRNAHEALDAHPAFAALMDGTMSASGYARLMTLFFGFYRQHDPLVVQACVDCSLDTLGFSYSPRSSILREDLAALGIDADGDRDPDAAPLAPAPSPGSIGGILYVIEGSMLGGAMLSRAVDALSGPASARADRYWKWCRDDGAARWAMTCGMIERLSQTEINRTDMISGAQLAFASFGRWLDGWRDDRVDLPVPVSVARC